MSMEFVGGFGGDPVHPDEYTMPAFMFNTGMLVCQTPNQCAVFESPKNTQVVRAPNYNQMDAGDCLNDGGWQ